MRFRSLLVLLPLLNCVACSDPQLGVKISFAPTWGGEAISCGSAGTALTDLRFFVSDLRMIAADGQSHPIRLDQELQWQQDDLALIDLEDGRGSCRNGSTEVYGYAVGFVPPGDYSGLQFTVGVPFGRNHANPLTAEAPLDLAAMHWHWRSGYKFLRAGLETVGDGFWIHVGSAGCEGTARNVTGCRFPNRVAVTLPDFDPREQVVDIDLAALLEGTDLDDAERSDCSSGPAEAACIAPFAALGLDFTTGQPIGPQRVFVVRP